MEIAKYITSAEGIGSDALPEPADLNLPPRPATHIRCNHSNQTTAASPVSVMVTVYGSAIQIMRP